MAINLNTIYYDEDGNRLTESEVREMRRKEIEEFVSKKRHDTEKYKADFTFLSGVMENGNGTVENKNVGEITFEAGEIGKSGYGIRHIIEQRYQKDGKNSDEITALMALVKDISENGTVTRENGRNIELQTDNGIVSIVRKESDDKPYKWVLTGFDDFGRKEATDAIQTVIAQYGYLPEYSSFRTHVGAVIASVDRIAQNEEKSISTQGETTMADERKEKKNIDPWDAWYELPIDVVERSEMRYAGSEETSGYAYQIRTDYGLKYEIAPDLRDLKEDEYLFIEYRRWLNGEENEHDFSAYIMRQNEDGSYSRPEDVSTRFNQTRTDRLAENEISEEIKSAVRTFIDKQEEFTASLVKYLSDREKRKEQSLQNEENRSVAPENDPYIDDGIEQIQANGGMSEEAAEAEIAAQENPRPDYLDEQGNPHWYDEEDEAEVLSDEEIAFLKMQDEKSQTDEEQAEDLPQIKENQPPEKMMQEMHDTMYHSAGWDDAFPSVFSSAEYKDLKRNEHLESLRLKAKAGDRDAADALVHEVADFAMIRTLKEKFPHAVVAPVIAEEASGNNQIPYAYANLLRENGFDIDTNIIQAVRAHHTGANSIKRLTNRVRFDGAVQQNKEYILIDDHVDYGGTLRDFKDYIETNGGKVIAFSTLTAIDKNTKISPTKENLEKLNEYGGKVDEILNQFGITDNKRGLTNGEVSGLIRLLSDKNRNREFESESQRRFFLLCAEISDAYQAKRDQEARTKPVLNRFLKLTANLPQGEQKSFSEAITKIVDAIKNENADVIRLINTFNKSEYVKKSPDFSQDRLNSDIKNILIADSLSALGEKEILPAGKNQPPVENTNSSLEKETLAKAGDLLKNMQFTSENYKKLLNVINEISDMNGLKNLGVPEEPETVQKSSEAQKQHENLAQEEAQQEVTGQGSVAETAQADERQIGAESARQPSEDTLKENAEKIPVFSMITQHGLQTFENCVVQKFNAAENSYTLSNGEATLSVTADTLAALAAKNQTGQSMDETSPAYEKLLQTQYDDYFRQRSNTAYNFRHNLSVYCRKEANSPVDALRIAKEIISRMPRAEREKTQKLLEKVAYENETVNEAVVRLYHEAIKEVPLNEQYISQNFPDKVVARPMYDTVSDAGKPVAQDTALIKGGRNYNLTVGGTIRNVNFDMEKLFGKGKESVHFDELKVVSASKEANTITLMDKDKSYFKLPRDTVLAAYKEQQLREMRRGQRHERGNAISLGYV